MNPKNAVWPNREQVSSYSISTSGQSVSLRSPAKFRETNWLRAVSEGVQWKWLLSSWGIWEKQLKNSSISWISWSSNISFYPKSVIMFFVLFCFFFTDIGDIAGVADVTIRQSYRLIYLRAAELFPTDFKFTTPVDKLPNLWSVFSPAFSQFRY